MENVDKISGTTGAALYLKLVNQACAWFLEIVFVGKSVYMLCVSVPRAIKNYSHEMKSE